ncbi:hypothetical protein Bca101_091792 [Brassica carinata]
MGKEVTAASYICSHGVESTEHHSAFFYAAADRSIGEKNRGVHFCFPIHVTGTKEDRLVSKVRKYGTPVRLLAVGVGFFSTSFVSSCSVSVCSSSSVTGSVSWLEVNAWVSDVTSSAHAAIALPTLILGAAPLYGSTTTGSTYPELWLTRSGGSCRSESPPPLLATFTYDETHRTALQLFQFGPRLCPLRLLLLRLYPRVYQRYPSTGFTSPIECGEADPFPENNVGEILLNKNLICSLLRNPWALRFRPFLLSVLFEIHIVSSESFLGGFSCRRLKPQFQGFFRQHPLTLPAIMLDSASNSPMESEVKRVSTALSFRLQIFLLPEPFGIHLVSQDNIDGCRASLFRLTGYLASIGFPSLFQSLSLGHFSVFSDYLKLFRAVVSRIQVKIICGSLYFELVSPCSTSIPYYLKLFRAVVSRIQVKIICGSLYFELVSPCNTSIPCFTALLSLLFILLSSIPLIVIIGTP